MLRMARVVRPLLLFACLVTAMTDAAGPRVAGSEVELRAARPPLSRVTRDGGDEGRETAVADPATRSAVTQLDH